MCFDGRYLAMHEKSSESDPNFSVAIESLESEPTDFGNNAIAVSPFLLPSGHHFLPASCPIIETLVGPWLNIRPTHDRAFDRPVIELFIAPRSSIWLLRDRAIDRPVIEHLISAGYRLQITKAWFISHTDGGARRHALQTMCGGHNTLWGGS